VPVEALDGIGEVVDSLDPLRQQCAAVLVASGTATLELALADVPQVVAYRVHPASYAIGRRLIRLSHISLPNVLSGRAVVPEFVQHFTADDLANALMAVARQVPDYSQVRREVGSGGAVERAARHVAAWL
jgi:lipid-A-disaccharide synthase